MLTCPSCVFRVLLCLVLAQATVLAAELRWVEVRSPNFSVVTDAGERKGLEIALRFEQMRAVFGTLIFRSRVSQPIPLQIVAFRDAAEFRRFVPVWKGKPVEVTGIFQSNHDRNFVALDLSSRDPWSTIFHEYAHALLSGNYPETQLWFDEGFAEYFSTIDIGNKEVVIGRAPDSAQMLVSMHLMPMRELIAVDRDSPVYNETGNRRSLFYAQSWLLAHYLFSKGRVAEAGTYFDLLHNRRLPAAEAFSKAFGQTLEDFDGELARYLRGGQRPLQRSEAPAGIDSGGYKVEPLEQAEARVVLADMHAHSTQYLDQGLRELEELLAAAPGKAAVHRGLGYAYLRKERFDRAAQHFRKAAALDDHDPRLLYYFALLQQRVLQATGREPDDVWEVIDALEKSISLDPTFADAHALLGIAHMWTNDADAAITSMRNAVRLSPRDQTYQAYLGRFYVAAQQWDQAAATFDRLSRSSDPKVAADAVAELERIARYREDPPAKLARQVRPPRTDQWESPKWKRRVPAVSVAETEEAAEKPPDTRPIDNLRGRIVAVDCSHPTGAQISIAVGKRTWKMQVSDRNKLLLIGAEEFSCSWRDREVVVNYRKSGPSSGDLVSLEIRTLTAEPVQLKFN
ncbi:MAG TPA: tetratricopeptide repeat protein [Terriglobales bacterium]|nr:tetratricopeptide repeat protein [Terriglobales bacterium]